MIAFVRRHRALTCAAILMAATLLGGFGHIPILREIASFLLVEDSLQAAVAIIPLGGEGKPPLRLIEAARLYRAGWAPLIVIVRGARQNDSQALQRVGVEARQPWEPSLEVLIREGVPASAILLIKDDVHNTLEELQAASRVLRSKKGSVIIVTSKYHTRRSRLTWHYVTEGRSHAIMHAASPDSFDPTQWWNDQNVTSRVLHEYLGIINYYAGFPVAR